MLDLSEVSQIIIPVDIGKTGAEKLDARQYHIENIMDIYNADADDLFFSVHEADVSQCLFCFQAVSVPCFIEKLSVGGKI